MLRRFMAKRRLPSRRRSCLQLTGSQLIVLVIAACALAFYLYWYRGMRLHVGFQLNPAHNPNPLKVPSFSGLKSAQEESHDILSTVNSQEQKPPLPGKSRARTFDSPVRFLDKAGVAVLRKPKLDACTAGGFVFLVASTGPDSEKQRNAVRATWGSQFSSGKFAGCVVFYAAATSGRELEELTLESDAKRDLVVLEVNASRQADHWERGAAVLMASSVMFGLAREQPKARFFIRTNDKAFWNAQRLSECLRESPSHKRIVGKVLRSNWVHRDKYDPLYTSREQFGGQMFPESALDDPGYVISAPALDSMLAHVNSTPLVYTRDMFITGILRAKANVGLEDSADVKISKILPLSACFYRLFVAAPSLSADEMLAIWPKFSNPAHKCSYSFASGEDAF